MQFRSKFFVVAFVGVSLAAAASAKAGIMLQSSAETPVGQGLTSYTLSAVSDAGEIINVVNNPIIVPNASGMGLHQVWAPITNAPTPTRGDQTAALPLWNDGWLPFDSHFFFTAENSLSVGGAFTETNSGAPGTQQGAVLPDFGYGAPTTGFGDYGFSTGSAVKGFTIASGNQGTNVQFAQLVMKEQESVLVSLGVLDTQGNRTDFTNVCIGAGCGEAAFMVGDAMLHGGSDSSPDADGNGDGIVDAADDVHTTGGASTLEIVPFVPPPKPPRPAFSLAAAPEPSSLMLTVPAHRSMLSGRLAAAPEPSSLMLLVVLGACLTLRRTNR